MMRRGLAVLAASGIALLTGCGETSTSVTAPVQVSYDGGWWIGSGNSVEDSTPVSTTTTDSTVTARGGLWGGSGN